jgi:hypothetical protein
MRKQPQNNACFVIPCPSLISLRKMTESVIVVHGGAWDIPDRLVDLNIRGVKEAAEKG